MLSDIEIKLDKGIREVIKESFGKDLEKMEEMEKTEIFFIVYKSLAMLLKRDFDMVTELQIKSITLNPTEESKEIVKKKKE